MAEVYVPGWGGFEYGGETDRAGAIGKLAVSQRNFRDGFVDLGWFHKLGERIYPRSQDEHMRNVADCALRACLSDVVDYKYRRELQEKDRVDQETEGGSGLILPDSKAWMVMTAPTYHQFPVDIRHAYEKDNGEPLTREAFFDTLGGVTPEVLSINKWMIAKESIVENLHKFLTDPSTTSVGVDGKPPFVVDHPFGPDEQHFLRYVVSN